MPLNEPPTKPQTALPAGPRPNWDDEADTYDSFVMCELEDTARYLDLVGIGPQDTVLDVCCGPGRITMLAAERAARVTGIDLSERMLEHARANVAARGLTNVTLQRVDWNCVLPGQNVKAHDVVIASRNLAMFDVEKLSALARRTVMLQLFADAPSIPALQGVLFSGCEAPGARSMPTPGTDDRDRPAAGPQQRPHGADLLRGRASCAYFDLLVKVYNAGYEPNVRILPERFRKVFATREQAVSWVCALRPALAAGNEERIAANTAPFLTPVDNGWEFCIATRAAIIWWDVHARV